MTAILQVFMRYKVYESYWVFNGEYHEYIDNVQNEEKNNNRKPNISNKKLPKN